MKSIEDFETVNDYLLHLFSKAIVYGMTPKQFWYGTDPIEFYAYRHAYLLKVTAQRLYENTNMWMSGTYNRLAIADVLSKESCYPELPFFVASTKLEKEKYEKYLLEKEKKAMTAKIHAQMAEVMKVLEERKKEKEER